jgi:rhamnosyltransferase
MDLVTSENTCSVIITFNPANDIYYALSRQLLLFKKIVIVDNGSSDLVIEQLSAFCNDNEQIDLISLKNNFGIAYALNVAIKKAIKLNYKWIVSFDQDSIPNDFLLDYYNSVIKSYSGTSKIGLIGGKFTSEINNCKHTKITWKKSLTIITSAALYNPEIFTSVGFFEEKLFIDGVDLEFNLRIRKSNYITIRIDQPLIQHKLGNPIEKRIFFATVHSTNHSLERRYYMARNHIIITKRYLVRFPFWIIKKNFFFARSVLQILLVEKDVSRKLFKMFIGMKDGLFLYK